MEAIRPSQFIKAIVKGSAAFFSAMIISALLFSSLGYIEYSQADSADTKVQLNIAPVLSLRTEKSGSTITELELSVTPGATNFDKDDLDVIVNTNNATGYTLTMADNDTDTAMHHATTTITDSIASLSSSATDTTFPDNTWGYSLDPISGTQTFTAIPASTSAATLKTTSAPATEDTTKVTFGVNVGSTLTAGTYQDTVVFSAVTNYVPNALEQLSSMQDMTPQVCAAANVGDEATLTDTRDNKTYVIRKLADGKCWMVQNLALGSSSAITLTPQDSNVSANFTLEPSSDDFGATDRPSDVDRNRMHDNGNNWVTPITVGSDSTINTTGTPPNQSQYVGNYYNWYTATASTGTYSMTSGDATSSICPKGWRLPTGDSGGEFQNLYNAYGNSSDFFTATNAVLSGDWSGTSAGYQGSGGYWWSSTTIGSTGGYFLSFDNSSIYLQVSDYKRVGNSVRCVAEGAFDISTMQDMTPEICDAATIGDSKALRDTRDSNTYMVRKMEDGKCWMVQNLALGSPGQDITLTPADSNVIADFTIPASAIQTSGNIDWGPHDDETAINTIHVYNNGSAWIDPTSAGNDATVNTTGTPLNQSQYIGNYYNWYTATASTGTYIMTSDDATSSICPKGWKLPTGNNGDFISLINALVNINTNTDSVPDASFALQSAPNYFILSGGYGTLALQGGGYSFSTVDQGTTGDWWSSTAYNGKGGATSAFKIYIGTSYVYPRTIGNKYAGSPVRCIAE